MKHILLECDVDARKLIWKKAKELWPQEWHRWPNITIGSILGIGHISLSCTKMKGDKPTSKGRYRPK
jgi:hypothetical protein